MRDAHAVPIRDVHGLMHDDEVVVDIDLGDAALVRHDEDTGYRIHRLAEPLQPGAERDLRFKLDVHAEDMTGRGAATQVVQDGGFFNNLLFPSFGYSERRELAARNDRRERGLVEPRRMPKLEDDAARANTYIGSDGDWIDFATTICTEADQVALAPGYLVREFTRNGRRCFSDEMDRPMLDFFAYLSGRGGELVDEMPLYRIVDQQYIRYRKGSLMLYRLREELGEAAPNRVLGKFLKAKACQTAPFATSAELLAFIRSEARPDQQGLITDLFEKISFHDSRVDSATAKRRAVGRYEATLDLHAANRYADGKGKETPGRLDDWIEVGAFRGRRVRPGTRAEGAVPAAAPHRPAGSDADRRGRPAPRRGGLRSVQQADRSPVEGQPQAHRPVERRAARGTEPEHASHVHAPVSVAGRRATAG